MALDPFLWARDCPSDALLDACHETLDRGICTVSRKVGQGITLFRSPGPQLSRYSLAKSHHDEPDAYELLARMGIVAVGGIPHNGAIRLTGGSVSACHVVIEPNSIIVRKQLRHSLLPAIDSLQRHRAEARWIEGLQRRGLG